MATVFQRTKKKPLPPGAQLVERKGRRLAEWLDARGKRRTARLSKDGSGILAKASTYTVRFVDEHGHTREVGTRCRDYAAAEQLGRELEKRAMQRREGLLDPAQERFAKAARKPIAEHAAAHIEHLAAAGNTAKHVRTVERHLRAIFSAAGIERLPELKSAAVLSAVSAMRNPPLAEGGEKQKQPASLATCNGHLRSVKGFSRWLWKQRLTPEDALLDLGLFNAETDRRHIRREMAAEEVHWLLDVTEQRTLPEHGAPGPTRAMCYRLAAATGFRANELRSLTTDSFDLDAAPPTCTVEAGYSKRRKRDVQPLPQALVEPLRAWLAGFGPGESVFAGIAGNTARMLRSDLTAARTAWLETARSEAEKEQMQATDFLLYSDRQGHVTDFHSLRVLFISRVVASGASVKEAQTLARHSTPVLTMNTYSRATLLDVAGAVSGLGDLLTKQPTRPQAEAAAMRATGTDGRQETAPKSAHESAHSQQAQEGSGWHSRASVRAADQSEPRDAREPETATIPAVRGASVDSEEKRRWWESNPRWRICNPLP